MTDNSTAPAPVPRGDLTVDQAAEALSNLNLSPEDEEEGDEEGETPEADQTEEQDPEDESEGEEGEPAPTYKVKVNGKEVEVTLDELQKGYSLQSDYTRKTQELADQRKTAEAEFNAVRAERAHAAQLLQALQAQLQQQQPQLTQAEWDHLYQTDPLEAMRQDKLHRDRQERLTAIQYEQQRIAQASQQDAIRQLQTTLQQESKLLTEKIPTWKDEAKAKAERELIKDFAVGSLGFTPEDVQGITDHRVVVALRKAWLYDTAMAKRQGLTQSLPGKKIAAPNAPVSVPRARAAKVGELKERASKSGSVDDAAKYFASML